jgi:hypothetical protein
MVWTGPWTVVAIYGLSLYIVLGLGVGQFEPDVYGTGSLSSCLDRKFVFKLA